MTFDREPQVNVGILSASEIRVDLKSYFTDTASGNAVTGPQTFALTPDGRISWQGTEHNTILLTPTDDKASFEVFDVVIGIGFHWERNENQRFAGALKIIVEGDKITLVNVVGVEEYLKSVVSSEMSAHASEEFLKAHAVISRSWLLAQIYRDRDKRKNYNSSTVTDSEIIRWYDHDDHTNFDVCADDHCQRYQGITRQTAAHARNAVEATRGVVLLDNEGALCDARFSKCCGGVFEEFEACWEPVHHHYLEAAADTATPDRFPDLTVEDNAREWILSAPEAYCNTHDAEILGQVLNNYDQETADFYRWTVTYTADELASLIKDRSGIDFGKIRALVPVQRGTSGRICRLRIEGTKRTLTVGKELEIRRYLSPSHLYSSAFVAEYGPLDSQGVPTSITLRGAGWGHGVGLCQIGAAVMGAKGFKYDQILSHYFKGATLKAVY